MELHEGMWKWLIAGAIVVVFLAHRTISRHFEQRRREWVDSLAVTFGSRATHGSDATSLFAADVGGRRCEIAQGYRSRTMDGRYLRGVRLIVTVPLRNVSEIYNLSFQRRNGERAAESLAVRSSGYAPREGWIGEPLREAIFDFYDVAGDREPLNLEGGALMYATSRRISGKALRDLVERQLAVAEEIETAL